MGLKADCCCLNPPVKLAAASGGSRWMEKMLLAVLSAFVEEDVLEHFDD